MRKRIATILQLHSIVALKYRKSVQWTSGCWPLSIEGMPWGMLCLVAQSCLTLCNPMDCSLPGSSVHGILQARILEWVAIPSSRGSSQLRDWTQVSCVLGRYFTFWYTREAQEYWSGYPSSGQLPDPGIKWVSCTVRGFFTSWATQEV